MIVFGYVGRIKQEIIRSSSHDNQIITEIRGQVVRVNYFTARQILMSH